MIDPGEKRGFFRISFQDIQVASRAARNHTGILEFKETRVQVCRQGPQWCQVPCLQSLRLMFQPKNLSESRFFLWPRWEHGNNRWAPIDIGTRRIDGEMSCFFSCLEPKKGMLFYFSFSRDADRSSQLWSENMKL